MTLDEKLQQLVTESVEGPPGPPARDPVNRPMIHHWCDAIGDANPVYLDEAAAAASVHGGTVAPPAMLQAWGMRGLQRAPQGAGGRGDVRTGPNELLNAAGYTSVVATDCEQEYRRYLRPGDVIRTSGALESISGEKHTALGDGYFVTNRTTYRDQNDEVVAEMRFRILWFKPARAGGG